MGVVTIGLIRSPLGAPEQTVNLRWEHRCGIAPMWVVDVAQEGVLYREIEVPGVRGVGRVSVTGAGVDMTWRAQVNGATIASGTFQDGNATDGGDFVHVTATSGRESGTAVGRVTVYRWVGGSEVYDWTNASDLSAWRVTGWPVAMGGWLTNRRNYCLRK